MSTPLIVVQFDVLAFDNFEHQMFKIDTAVVL